MMHDSAPSYYQLSYDCLLMIRGLCISVCINVNDKRINSKISSDKEVDDA